MESKMKFALVKTIDTGQYLSIACKYLIKTSTNGVYNISFKTPFSVEVKECTVVAFNDDKTLLTQMAKLANNNVPFVKCKIINESIASDVLSNSYADFSEDSFKSPWKTIGSISKKCKTNDLETSTTSASPVVNGSKDIRSSTPEITVNNKSATSKRFDKSNDSEITINEISGNLSTFLKNVELDSSKLKLLNIIDIADISSIPIVSIECLHDNEIIKTVENNTTITSKSNSKVEKKTVNTEDVRHTDSLHFNVDAEEDEEDNNVINSINIQNRKATETTTDVHEKVTISTNINNDIVDDDGYDDNNGSSNEKDPDFSPFDSDNFEDFDQQDSLYGSDPKVNDEASDNDISKSKLTNQNNDKIINREEKNLNKEENLDKENFNKQNLNNTEHIIRTTRQRKIFSSIEAKDELKLDDDGKLNFLSKNLNTPGTPNIDIKNRYVPRIKLTATKSKPPKRLAKKHCCYFCQKLVIDQIRRHINNCHRDNQLMKEIARLGKTEAHKAVTNLISLGDYNYNYATETGEQREMLVARRPNQREVIKPKVSSETGDLIWPKKILDSEKPCTIVSTDSKEGQPQLPKIFNYNLPDSEKGEQYIPCDTCFKTIKRSALSKHKCADSVRLPNRKGRVNECDALIPDINPIANQRLRDLVLKTMRSGYIKDIVKRDESIVLFGNSAVTYYNNDQDYQMISHQLRLLAEILHFAQSRNNEIEKFEDILHRDHINLIEESFRTLVEYDAASAIVVKENKTKELTVIFKKVIDFFISRNKRLRNDAKANEILSFWDALKPEFKILNKKSRECHLKKQKKKKPKVLPKIDDINKLVAYAEEIRRKSFELLSKRWDEDAYEDLNKSTLILLQIFNRKRQGEISRLLIEDLEETCIYKLHDDCNGDEYTSLSPENQEAAKDFYRVSIVSKKGIMNVGLIIHKDLLDTLNMIINFRPRIKSIKSNKYVFADVAYNSNVDKHYKAYLIMKEYSVKCGADKPGTLRGTLLRKQVATMMYGINTDDVKLKDLARFLGHDYEIHKNYYRQQIPVRELINITPMLQLAQGNHFVESKDNRKDSETKNIQKNADQSNVSEYIPDESMEDQSLSLNKSNDNSYNFFEEQKKLKEVKKKQKGRKRRLDSEPSMDSPNTKKCKRITWNDEEKKSVAAYIEKHGMPTKVSAEYLDDMIKTYPILLVNDRTHAKIRAYLNNNNF